MSYRTSEISSGRLRLRHGCGSARTNEDQRGLQARPVPSRSRTLAAAAFHLALASFVLACSSKPKTPQTTPEDTETKTTDGTPDREPAPLEGVACSEQPCMVHASTGAHHYCLNAGSGLCFQYGGHCTPTDGCMLDPNGAYRKCTTAKGGTCAEFGAACEPAKSCAFDKTSNRYRLCKSWTNGTCSSYSGECTPG